MQNLHIINYCMCRHYACVAMVYTRVFCFINLTAIHLKILNYVLLRVFFYIMQCVQSSHSISVLDDGTITKQEFVSLWQLLTHQTQELAEAFFYLGDLNDDNVINTIDLAPLHHVFDLDGKNKEYIYIFTYFCAVLVLVIMLVKMCGCRCELSAPRADFRGCRA